MSSVKLSFLITILLYSITFSQWKQTSGPEGGNFSTVFRLNGVLYAVTDNGRIFRQESELSWSFFSNGYYGIDEVIPLGNSLAAITAGGMAISNNGGLDWEKINTRSTIGTYFVNNGELIVSMRDSLFALDPVNATLNYTGIKTSVIVLFNGEPTTSRFFGISSLLIKDGRIFIFSSIALTGSTGIYYTDDNGEHWTKAEGLTNVFDSSELIKSGETLYVNTNSGVYRSTDNGANWVKIMMGFTGTQVSGILKIASLKGQLYCVAYLSSQFSVYHYQDSIWVPAELEKGISMITVTEDILYGFNSFSVYEYKSASGEWISQEKGLVASTAVLWVVRNDILLASASGAIWISYNKGEQWIKTGLKFKGFTQQLNKIFAWGDSGIFVSQDGIQWSNSSNGIPASLFQNISAVSEINGVLYAGINKIRARMHLPPVWEAGGFYRSFDHGATWQYFSAGLPTETGIPAPIYRIIPTQQGIITYTLGGTFLMGEDENSFRMLAGLPSNESVYDALVFDNLLIIHTYTGIRKSTDFGLSWELLNHGLPNDQLFLITLKLFKYEDRLYVYGSQPANSIYRLTDTAWVLSDFPVMQGVIFNKLISEGVNLYAPSQERGIWQYSPVTGIKNDITGQTDYFLSQNYPNPFNPSTRISFTLPRQAYVSLKVYSVDGQLAESLISEDYSSGNHSVIWHAAGRASGVYICILNITENNSGIQYRLSNKMILTK